MHITVVVAEASAAVAVAEQTGRIDRAPVGWTEALGKDLFEVEMTCLRRDLRCVEELAAEVLVGKDSVAVGIGVVVVAVGRRRSPVEAGRMHRAIVPVVSDPEVARAKGSEGRLIVVCRMDWMEQMFVTAFFSGMDWMVAEAAGIAVCPGGGNWVLAWVVASAEA